MKKLLLCCLLITLTGVIGCGDKDNDNDPVSPQEQLLVSDDNIVIAEDQTLYVQELLEITQGEELRVEMNLKSWSGDYGIELILLSDEQAARLEAGLSFSADWHETVVDQGTHTYIVHDVTDRDDYRFVVDNSDAGWETTDFDGVADNAIFDLELILVP